MDQLAMTCRASDLQALGLLGFCESGFWWFRGFGLLQLKCLMCFLGGGYVVWGFGVLRPPFEVFWGFWWCGPVRILFFCMCSGGLKSLGFWGFGLWCPRG